jgi:hypothetical protein
MGLLLPQVEPAGNEKCRLEIERGGVYATPVCGHSSRCVPRLSEWQALPAGVAEVQLRKTLCTEALTSEPSPPARQAMMMMVLLFMAAWAAA